ncbi:hypothetical protein GGC65_002306 [Sphingopyxis sp. OAS728]|uniref:P-loop NTPase fold protein n=1 Tax=Sphingopyxis sp. OAS728 TaxID=2663823 RepID=UPI00178AFB5F|nr:P-loop NTPase fold protein [Sphingopyxis sp. OAS728]MBE1527850.1 hypothetical protein [Sphingopyxis sp. OAS728]
MLEIVYGAAGYTRYLSGMKLPFDARQDRAIRDEYGDKLERGPFVDSLVRALVRVDRDDRGITKSAEATGYVVGLTGKWGLGKSSVLNLLALKLGSMDRVIVAQFNPWLLGKGDELLTGFFNALRAAVGRNRSEEFNALRDELDRYWGAILFSSKVTIAATDVGTSAGFFEKILPKSIKSKPISPEDERSVLEKKITDLRCAVVVLIDELDRVEDDDVKAVARLIKAVGEIRGVSYLVAYDPKRVAEALGGGRTDECREAGNSYLEKIVQHPIPLRPLFRGDAMALLDAALEQHKSALPEEPTEAERDIRDRVLDAIETPREVKRLVGAFAVLEEAVRGEISPFDVLGYCWLATKAPALRDAIAAKIEELVDDPGELEMVRRVSVQMDKGRAPDVTSVLGPSAAAHKHVLELLFPRFTDRGVAGSGNRLSRRKNLIRMLYLGNPPGMIPRREIEALWMLWAADLTSKLLETSSEGKLPDLLDRIEDLLPDLPEAGDDEFWSKLSDVFVRDHDWLDGPNSANELSRDAARSLARLAARDVRQIPRVRKVLEALIREGDLVIAPWILRNEMRANGLSRNSPSGSSQALYDKTQVEDLMRREFPRYRTAILSGLALRRLPNMEIFYALLNASAWDEHLRENLTQQLIGAEAIGTFAGLIVPPGYATELNTINEFCNAEVLNARVGDLLADPAAFPDPWIKESVNRLHRTLNGRDPHFDD